ncbi:hypothetical protein M5K25_023150 [Dendrobium thyrsiflorum]|uniref:Sodium channel modifier 1 acidic C-terminal domain-containing protein n=1 Tax=Dendrobium thyrsiflorum TaxID=117978 RepID=A0ABD0U817_DENTH
MAGRKVEVLEGELGQLKTDFEEKISDFQNQFSSIHEKMDGRFAALEDLMKKMIDDKQKPASSETIGGHGRGGDPNPSRGRENPEVEVLEGDDGMPPLEPLSREELSRGYDRQEAEYVGRREEFYRRGAGFERIQRRGADFERGRADFHSRGADFERIQRRGADFEGRREEIHRRGADFEGNQRRGDDFEGRRGDSFRIGSLRFWLINAVGLVPSPLFVRLAVPVPCGWRFLSPMWLFGRCSAVAFGLLPPFFWMVRLKMHIKGSRHIAAETQLREKELSINEEINKRIALSGDITDISSSICPSSKLKGSAVQTKPRNKPLIEKTRQLLLENHCDRIRGYNLNDGCNPATATSLTLLSDHVSQQIQRTSSVVPFNHNENSSERITAVDSKMISDKNAELRKRRAKELQFSAAGWKRDGQGKWYKDENVEFDSDEEDPNVFFS